ncbi:hypothetical protein Rsub_01808 [Raphidocelis subcapitata]|uniref:Uncharacterized protein n=1 Tax=Raphidocelis subcapitata TaxID=307507 RepID=A0A2V0NNE3_9CHLO|nr:hypothetical protein Rsub_01808 [Raphidocelis subcapitata]|eukprot:GBF89091.1 hypothetical protein Rsub_01808 [Raphidocelis subcapitata]
MSLAHRPAAGAGARCRPRTAFAASAPAARIWFQSGCRRRECAMATAAAAPEAVLGLLADAGGLSAGSAAVGAAAAAALGAAGLRFYCYSQLEYATAAMLSNWVPRGGNGAKVIQLGGGARQLYYYPKNVVQVTNVGDDVNKRWCHA